MFDINLDKVAFPQQLDAYRQFTKNENEVQKLWQFDINLKIIFIKYSLIIEQILKARFLEVVKDHQEIESLIKEFGPVKAFKKHHDFKHVPESFAKKTYNVVIKKGLEPTFKFYNMIELCSFSQFKLLVENMHISLRDKWIEKIIKQTGKEWSEMELIGAIRNAEWLRNICAHNGNLLNPEIKKNLMAIGNVYTVRKAMDNLTDLMKNTNADIKFNEEYMNLYKKYRPTLMKVRAWI